MQCFPLHGNEQRFDERLAFRPLCQQIRQPVVQSGPDNGTLFHHVVPEGNFKQRLVSQVNDQRLFGCVYVSDRNTSARVEGVCREAM